MKIKISLLLFIVLAGCLYKVSPVSAHFLETDKLIGAVLHIDPNDAPVAGKQASFFLEFKDQQNKFDPKNCDCIFQISENNQPIFTQPLFQNESTPSLDNAAVFYTFSKPDVYQITVSGKPLTPNSFHSFNLVWNIRVEATDSSAQAANPYFKILIYGLLAVLAIILVLVFALKKSRTKNQESKHVEKDNSNLY